MESMPWNNRVKLELEVYNLHYVVDIGLVKK